MSVESCIQFADSLCLPLRKVVLHLSRRITTICPHKRIAADFSRVAGLQHTGQLARYRLVRETALVPSAVTLQQRALLATSVVVTQSTERSRGQLLKVVLNHLPEGIDVI